MNEARVLTAMVAIRVISSAIEFSAAMLMLKMGSVKSALAVNAVLGLVGPAILISAALVGLSGIAGNIHPGKLLMIICGVALVLLGTR